MVFYRKYRPQTIDDLDSANVRDTLSSVLSQEDAPHAFLFTGPKGLGKTSSARIVAKAVNCTTDSKKRKNGFEPCGICNSCESIVNGTNMDILEIDAASNRGIDEIRDLKEKIRLSPLSSKVKVYIIDEVHMLTTEAFNALLKTLEEPPSHAMFILCTTEPQKVPATILSRCFHIAFKKATDDELVRSFERIAKGENLKIEKEALIAIAKLSDGSFRDGAKTLEEIRLLARSNDSNSKASGQTDQKSAITKELVESKYQSVSINKHIEDILESFSSKNIKTALSIVSELNEKGIDMKHFSQKLIEKLHQELLSKFQSEKSEFPSAEVSEIKDLLILLTRAYNDIKYAVIPQLPLELAIIDWSNKANPKGVIAEAIEEVLEGAGGEVSITSLRKKVGNIKKITAMYGAEKKTPEVREDIPSDDMKVTLLHTANSEITKDWLMLFWRNLISEMKLYNHTIAGVLRGCRINEFDKENLIIETSYKFHKERLDDMKTKAELSRIAKLLTGKDVKVEVQLRK
jgi:DNA polymerase III subunit gamma/tau